MASISNLVYLVLGLSVFSAVVSGRALNGDIAMVTDGEAENAIRSGRFTELLGNSPSAFAFAGFAAKYGKVYKTLAELKHRFGVFVKNVEVIEATNKKKLSYTLAINQFADVAFEEFRSTHLLKSSQNCSATKGNHHLTDAKLPEEKDWRKDGIVSPVKNQASCGSCWTFSTTGSLESAHAQATGKMVLLSEQQLVDCAGEFNNFGCGGGLPSQAFEYIRYNGGLDTEESYPYSAQDGTCKYLDNTVGAQVYDVVNITEGAEHELKHAVGLVRPVSVAFEVLDSFQLYSDGVYSSPLCHDGPQTVNHAVLAVGYGVDAKGIPYWTIKNSWGELWGLDGYFHIEMGKNMCGVATCASYPIVPEDLTKH